MTTRAILVALDGSPVSRLVLDEAARCAHGARLVLYRAVTLPHGMPRELLSLSPDQVEQSLVAAARQEMEALAAQLPPSVAREVRVEEGTPWRSIIKTARELGAELIVLGGHGYGAVDRLLGTTAGRVVEHADRSVLVVRPRP